MTQPVFKFQNGGLLSQGKNLSWINWQRIGTQSKFKPIGLSSQFPTDQATNSSSCVLNERPCNQPSQSTQITDDSETSGDSSALQTPIPDPDATGTTELSNEIPQEPGTSQAPNSAQSG